MINIPTVDLAYEVVKIGNVSGDSVDGRMIERYNFFIFEIVKAHAARSPKHLNKMHFHGKGVFNVAGKTMNLNRWFTKWKDM